MNDDKSSAHKQEAQADADDKEISLGINVIQEALRQSQEELAGVDRAPRKSRTGIAEWSRTGFRDHQSAQDKLSSDHHEIKYNADTLTPGTRPSFAVGPLLSWFITRPNIHTLSM